MALTVRTFLCAAAAIALAAGECAAQKVGTTSMQFLEVMPCARGTAMGDAYTVLAAGAEAAFWNPGGVAHIQSQEFSATYTSWIFDAQQGGFSFASPLGDGGAVAAQIQYVDYGMFDEASADPQYLGQGTYPGLTGRQFHAFAYVTGLTYSRQLTEKFSTGISAKYAYESLFDQHTVTIVGDGGPEQVNTYAHGFLFDFGLRYNTGYRSIQLGASIQNFGASLKYATESSPAPLLFRVGMTGELMGADGLLVSDVEDNRVLLAADLFQPNDYTQQQHLGIEYEYAKVFAIRAGYKFNYDTQGFTAGIGLHQPLAGMNVTLDYSYGAISMFLGNVHRITLGAEL